MIYNILNGYNFMVLCQSAVHAAAVKCGGKFVDAFLKGNVSRPSLRRCPA